MSLGTVLLVYLVIPTLVFFIPILIVYLYKRRDLPRLPDLARNQHLQGVSFLSAGDAAPTAPRLKIFLCSSVMAVSALIGMDLTLGQGNSEIPLSWQIRDGLFVGIALGAVCLFVAYLTRQVRSALGAASKMSALGAVGVWNPSATRSWPQRLMQGFAATGEEMLAKVRIFDGSHGPHPAEELNFTESVCLALAHAGTLEAICADGTEVMSLLAIDPADLRKGPLPHLRSTRLRLLVLPPRSGRTDPERKKLSCSEVALSKINRTPEEHWRHLRNAIDLLRSWNAAYGMQVDLRFLESRPAFRCLLAGNKAWVTPWGIDPKHWLGCQADADEGSLANSFRDYFVNEWGVASTEIELPLTDGATGSTVIRKGVEVPEAVTQFG